jgi:hypothetical protein
MANQFIGFPVPRARIADMIDDELAGAGYLTLPWKDAVHIIDFVSLDGLDVHTAGTGYTTLNDDEVQVTADGPNNDVARIKKELLYSEPVLTWSKDRAFSVRAALMSYGNANNHLRIGLGEVGVSKGFGFVVESNILRTYTYNGGLGTPHDIEDWSAGAFNNQRILKAVREAADCLKFYVDGVLVHTATTHIPTGTTSAQIILKMEARNIGAGDLCRIALSSWNFWQEA